MESTSEDLEIRLALTPGLSGGNITVVELLIVYKVESRRKKTHSWILCTRGVGVKSFSSVK